MPAAGKDEPDESEPTSSLTPHAAVPEDEALAPVTEGPSSLAPPALTLGADSTPSFETPAPPPVTADVPESDDTPPVSTLREAPKPSWASSPPPPLPAGDSHEHEGALGPRVKRSPGKIALAAVAAAALFFIVRKLR